MGAQPSPPQRSTGASKSPLKRSRRVPKYLLFRRLGELVQ